MNSVGVIAKLNSSFEGEKEPTSQKHRLYFLFKMPSTFAIKIINSRCNSFVILEASSTSEFFYGNNN